MTLRLVAEHATMWNFIGPPDVMKHKISVLNRWCEKIGRDPAEIEKTLLLLSPADIERLDEYVAVGVTHFILGMGTPFDFGAAQRLLDWKNSK